MRITTYSGENFILGQCIGSGGMSKVFSAGSEGDGSLVAVKMLKNSGQSKNLAEAKRELEGEVHILEVLNHKGIKGVPGLLGKGDSFYVMEYVSGRTFGKNELSARECIELGITLCDILCGLHEGEPSVLYLDLKPSNIMRSDSGEIRLIDFGTARIPGNYRDGDEITGYGAGTKGYAAPEQYGGLVCESIQTDIYLLGRTLDALLNRNRRNGFLSAELMKVIDRCTAARKGARYSDCREVRAALLLCRKKAAKSKSFFMAGLVMGLILFALSALFILMFFMGKISVIYGIISVLLGRPIWNNEIMAESLYIFCGRNCEMKKRADDSSCFIDIVKTYDTIEI
jgi:serine/threonine-protein kinase